MKQKPVTPYQRLLDEAQEFASKVENPHMRQMWTYPKDRLCDNWRLNELAERVAAADQLGYDVKLVIRDGNLQVLYVKKMPGRPWSFK